MSPRASRDGKQGRRSWRYAEPSSKAAGSKRLLRIFLTLLLLITAGVFFWMIWRTPYRNAHLAIIEVPANRRVRTTPFARNDVQHLLDVKVLRAPELWTDIRDNSDFADQVEPKARELLSKAYDNLILYINAPGISDAGIAYLTHSDFLTPGAAFEGRHAVADLLAKMADAGPGVKLIVLDSTSVDVDPRLGLVVNEFVRLLETDVKKLKKDSNLFVLLPAGPFQVSRTSYGDRQSLFGKYLVDGLAGAADRQGGGDGNRFVSLYELYEHVRVGCATAVDSTSGAQQTPVLLQAGIGYVPPSTELNTERLRLTAVAGKIKPPPEEPAKAIEEKKAGTSPENQGDKAASRRWPAGPASHLAWMQATAEKQEGPTDPSAEAKEKPAPANQPAESDASTAGATPEKTESGASPETQPAAETVPAEMTPAEQLLSRFEKVWRLRDVIQNPQERDVTPVTFAPHLWRALEAELLFVERQVLADPVFDQPAAKTVQGEAKPVLPLPKNVTAIEDLISTFAAVDAAISSKRPRRSPANDRSLRTRLLKAWDQFAEKQLEDEEKFTLRAAPEAVHLRDQARDLDSLVYALPYYVRWRARAHQSLADGSEQRQLLDRYLEATIRLATTLSSLRKTPQLSYNDQHLLEQVRADLDEASSLRTALDNALWEGDDRGSPIVLERLLSTPLLDAPRRMQLLRGLLQAKTRVPGDRAVPKPWSDLSVSSEHWQRLHSHCAVELRLAALALGATHNRVKHLSAELAKADELAHAESPEAELWQTYRSVGAQFGEFYESLPKLILDRAAGDYAIHIVDSRDVDDPRNSDLDAQRPLQLHLNYEPDVKIEIAEAQNRSEFDLKLNESRKLVLTIRATREKDASEPLESGLDSTLLDVTREPPGPLEKKSGWYESTVIYEVRAKDGVTQLPGRETTKVSFWSEASKQLNQRLNLTFKLPRPDQISLEVLKLSKRSQSVQREQDGSLTLEVFPTNLPKAPVTEFQLRARNESGKPRKIRAELYIVKPKDVAKQKPGTISPELRKELFREQASSLDLTQLELVADVNDVEVAVDESAVLAFKAPAAAPATAPPPASTPEKPVSPPTLKDAGFGMVCRLHDDAGAQWIKWIKIEPIPLHRYVAAKSWYESGRVVVELTGKPDLDNHFPPNGLTLTWDPKPDFPDDTQRSIKATILEPGDEHQARLYIEVEPDDITREVYIGVNGSPRVLSFRVSCRESGDKVKGEETRIERRSIAITKLSIPDTKQIFQVPTPPIEGRQEIYLDGPPGGKFPEGEVPLKFKQKVIVAMPVEKLRVHFHLDAPVEGLRPERGDAVEMLVGAEREVPKRLGVAYSDRHLSTYLSGIGDNGVVQLGMLVEELFIDITPHDLNAELQLIAKLTVDQRQPLWSQAIPVIFDGTAPVIKKVTVPAQLALESKQVVEVDVEELSGISDARYWFAVSRDQPVAKPLTAALLGPPVRQGKLLRLRFNVDTAGMDEGEYLLAIQVDDHVKLSSGVVHTKTQIKKKEEKPVFATIWGNIQFSSPAAQAYSSVQLQTADKKPVPGFEAKEVKRYEFPNVPAGEYLIHAETTISTGPRKVDVPLKIEKPGRVRQDLNLK